MPLTGPKTFVGFGFGPMQTGLFVYEAFQSGSFGRIVIAEVVAEIVDQVRESNGFYALNIAHSDAIESVQVGPIEMVNPAVESDRARLIDALKQASEVATAVPSTKFYTRGGPGSIHRLLARGLDAHEGGPALVYAAENHNEAAEILEKAVLEEVPAERRTQATRDVQFLNTVIGKMSGVISDPEEIDKKSLSPLTPRGDKVHLVEAFNRILISKPTFPSNVHPVRGIKIFGEKDDLLPFEEAKLYGHNAAHALAGYLAADVGLEHMHQLARRPKILDHVRSAFIEESGAALIHKYAGSDPLFTQDGYIEYVDDLLDRMLNPHLGDRVDRVTRDPERKLGWEDRLVGTMRIALSQGIRPRRFAVGAAAALAFLRADFINGGSDVETACRTIWEPDQPDPGEMAAVLNLIEEGLEFLRGRYEARG